MPRELLAVKLDALLDSIRPLNAHPRAFRMGRFSMGSRLFSLLEEKGLTVDSSVAPGREWSGGPSHLSAPADPYFPDPADVCRPGRSGVLEAPVTIVPVLALAGPFLQALGRAHAGIGVLRALQHLLFLPVVPAWTGLRRLKAAASLHRQRGGRALTLLLHSSELMPGGYLRHRSEADVRAFLKKLERFLRWLMSEARTEPVTLSELRGLYERKPLTADRKAASGPAGRPGDGRSPESGGGVGQARKPSGKGVS
jgi:hypothetical protein